MYDNLVFFSDILLGSFFEIDSPGQINALLSFSSYLDSSTDVSSLHHPMGTVYIFRLSSSRFTVVPSLYNSGSFNSKALLIQPGSITTSFLNISFHGILFTLLLVMCKIWCILCLTLFSNLFFFQVIS